MTHAQRVSWLFGWGLQYSKMAPLREDQDLREFVIQDVQQTEEDKILGTGSYGTVEEVQLQLVL